MVPAAITVREGGRTLVLQYADGTQVRLAAEYLRVESPSAEVQGHTPSQKKLVAGKAAVRIVGADPVGNYALKLTFSDGHSTGIYPWGTLQDMARDYDSVWAAYCAALAARGLSREG